MGWLNAFRRRATGGPIAVRARLEGVMSQRRLRGRPGRHGAGPWLAAPFRAAIVVSVPLLDLVIYLQHVIFHAVPGLWCLHRMHHGDFDVDAATDLRFHPVETLISMGIKLVVVTALGPPALVILLFAVTLGIHRVHPTVDPPRVDTGSDFAQVGFV